MSDSVYEKRITVEDMKSRKIINNGDFYGENGTITNLESISSGGSGTSTNDHRALTNRSAIDSHPQSAITGLGAKFNEIDATIAEHKTVSLTINDIIDNLTTKDSAKVLSANQGSLLEEQISDLAANITKAFHIQDDDIPTKDDLPSSLTENDEGKVYIVLDTGYMYLWTGSSYKQVNGLTDLSNYYNKSQVDTRVDSKQNATTDSQEGQVLVGGVTPGTFDTLVVDTETKPSSTNLITSGAAYASDQGILYAAEKYVSDNAVTIENSQTINGQKTFNAHIRTKGLFPIDGAEYVGSASAVYADGYFQNLHIKNQPTSDEHSANKKYVDTKVSAVDNLYVKQTTDLNVAYTTDNIGQQNTTPIQVDAVVDTLVKRVQNGNVMSPAEVDWGNNEYVGAKQVDDRFVEELENVDTKLDKKVDKPLKLVYSGDWISQSSAPDNNWHSICWSPELRLFCAVPLLGKGNIVMTSSDGINWSSHFSAEDNTWRSVCWSPELMVFCAVSSTGTTDNRIMISSDGITWNLQTSPTDNDWYSVCWSPELMLFCAVAINGSGNRVMTSVDGINWVSQASATNNEWRSVCWSPELGLFVAVAYSGTGNRVMTSPDGVNWTLRVSAADNNWFSVCWSPELMLFCAVSDTGTGNRVMTSPDGVNWILQVSATDNAWRSVCWSPELMLFCAVSNTGSNNRIMISPDGINWASQTSPVDNQWLSVCWSPELKMFAAVSVTGTGNRVMTSTARMELVNPDHNMLAGRSILNAHPISAITGLNSALDTLDRKIVAAATAGEVDLTNYATHSEVQTAIDTLPSEAPADGKTYGRRGSDHTWQDVSIPDLTNFATVSDVSTAISNHNTSDTAHEGIVDKVEELQNVVPINATNTDPLVVKSDMTLAISNMEANTVTFDVLGNPFPTKQDLVNAIDQNRFFYQRVAYTPTRLDQLIIVSDASAPAPYVGFSSHYTYDGINWNYDYSFNKQFTVDELNAMHSGITGADVAKLRSLDPHLDVRGAPDYDNRVVLFNRQQVVDDIFGGLPYNLPNIDMWSKLNTFTVPQDGYLYFYSGIKISSNAEHDPAIGIFVTINDENINPGTSSNFAVGSQLSLGYSIQDELWHAYVPWPSLLEVNAGDRVSIRIVSGIYQGSITDLSSSTSIMLYPKKAGTEVVAEAFNNHTQNLQIHVTPAEKTLVGTIPTLTDTVNTDIQNLLDHRNSDRFKWNSSWSTELDIYEELAKSQGLKPDPDNNYVIMTGDTYTVTNPYGGLLKMTTININNGFTVVSINGVQVYTSEGSSDNLSYIKYLRVLYNDIISVTSTGGSNVITLTPAIPDPDSPLLKYYNEIEKKVTNNANQILNLQARFENKTLSGTKTDIEAQAQSAAGYTVNNSLGGRITGYGVNAILGSTGQVNVNHNGEITEVYNNLGLLSLLAPVPALVEDVADGDIVTSTGMGSLFFEPYVAASA